MLFTSQPSAFRLLASCDAEDHIDDFLHALKRTDNCSTRPACKTRVVEPDFTYTSIETEGTLEIELPGVDRNDLTVEVQGRRLMISGKRFKRESGDAEGPVKKVKTTDNKENSDDVPAENVDVPVKEHLNTANDGGKSSFERENHTSNGKNVLGDGLESPEKSKLVGKDRSDNVPTAGESKDESKNTAEPRKPSTVFKGIFRLHPKIDSEKIAVAYHQNGVLNLRMPYREKALPRKIAIV